MNTYVYRIAPLVLFLLGCMDEQANQLSSSPSSRYMIVPKNFIATPITDDDRQAFRLSMLEQRKRAWDTVRQLTAPVSNRIALSDGNFRTITLPTWATWYGSNDIQRIFSKLYSEAGPTLRKARQPFSDDAIRKAMAWNQTMVLEFDNWSPQRLDQLILAANTPQQQLGLIGLNRTLYSPAYVQHILANYQNFQGCLATMPGVTGGQDPISSLNFTLCFDQEFPVDAVAIKTNWERIGTGATVSAFDTAAGQLDLAAASGEWGVASRRSDPDSDAIVTMESPDGAKFRLTAMHAMTKENRDWHWITLWWSDEPTKDFGEDRPELLGQWNQYKMCNVMAFDAVPADLTASDQYRGLNASFAALAAQMPGKSWCSNPVLEQGKSNFKTNCIGCHQHGGTLLTNEEIVARGAEDGEFALAKVRRNFPADYAWSWNRNPENISQYIVQQLEYYDLYD